MRKNLKITRIYLLKIFQKGQVKSLIFKVNPYFSISYKNFKSDSCRITKMPFQCVVWPIGGKKRGKKLNYTNSCNLVATKSPISLAFRATYKARLSPFGGMTTFPGLISAVSLKRPFFHERTKPHDLSIKMQLSSSVKKSYLSGIMMCVCAKVRKIRHNKKLLRISRREGAHEHT